MPCLPDVFKTTALLTTSIKFSVDHTPGCTLTPREVDSRHSRTIALSPHIKTLSALESFSDKQRFFTTATEYFAPIAWILWPSQQWQFSVINLIRREAWRRLIHLRWKLLAWDLCHKTFYAPSFPWSYLLNLHCVSFEVDATNQQLTMMLVTSSDCYLDLLLIWQTQPTYK